MDLQSHALRKGAGSHDDDALGVGAVGLASVGRAWEFPCENRAQHRAELPLTYPVS